MENRADNCREKDGSIGSIQMCCDSEDRLELILKRKTL